MERIEPNGIRVHRLTPEDWQLWRKLRLDALAEAPYAFGAKLSDWQGAGDTEARWRARLSDLPLNLIADWRQTPVGMASATAPDPTGSVALLSMWVAPFARGRGVGDSLIHAVIAWARERLAPRLVLAVFPENEPAVALYRRHGFVDVGPVPGGGSGNERRLVLPL